MRPHSRKKTAELDARLTAYLKEISAPMAKPNPNYDAAKAEEEAVNDRRDGKAGKQGKKRK